MNDRNALFSSIQQNNALVMVKRLYAMTLLFFLMIPTPAPGSGEGDLRELVGKPDHIIIMRHALAPGGGDPPQFRPDDCTTQRNLSPEGREQAARIGTRLRAAGPGDAKVYSSQWCRCLETADLLNLGPVTELPLLNSFFRSREREGEQTQALRAWIQSADLTRPVVLVTHQVNITALTGIFPVQGEFLILRREPGVLQVAARFAGD
jgi:8-oxo-(d)GTP phosphatase